MSPGARLLRNLDLVVLIVALPVFIAAKLPLLGWGATTGAWLVVHYLQAYLERRAFAKRDRRLAIRARAASLIARLYVVGLTVLGAGLLQHKAGAAAGALAVVVFTVHFALQFVVKPYEDVGE